jgi:acyl transferase domain-containing protein
MLSADGKCHTFDDTANGYCRSEGCGALVLKRLSDALRDGDSIYAVVRGSSVLQDGKSASLTAPNGKMQQVLLEAALADAGLRSEDVRYVEAHGTGTPLGDPIETEALSAVFGGGRAAEDLLYVSSVKGNVGHLEPAAGMVGLMSAVLALQHEQAPPNAQLRTLNPKVAASVEGAPLAFPTEATALRRLEGRPLVAGVSSFGYSGTIAHVLLEEAPVSHRRPRTRVSSSAPAELVADSVTVAGITEAAPYVQLSPHRNPRRYGFGS